MSDTRDRPCPPARLIAATDPHAAPAHLMQLASRLEGIAGAIEGLGGLAGISPFHALPELLASSARAHIACAHALSVAEESDNA